MTEMLIAMLIWVSGPSYHGGPAVWPGYGDLGACEKAKPMAKSFYTKQAGRSARVMLECVAVPVEATDDDNAILVPEESADQHG